MKNFVASAVLALTALVCLSSSAQEPLRGTVPEFVAVAASEPGTVESASAMIPANVLPSAPRQEAMLKPGPALVTVAPTPVLEAPRPKVFDKKFLGLGALVFATTSVDMEFTQHCLKARTCRELN